MQWTGMGKIACTPHATPVPLASTSGPAKKVNTLLVTYDPADGTDAVYIQDNNGNKMASMNAATCPPIVLTAPGSNQLDLRNFAITAGIDGAGPYVAYGVD